MHLKISTLRDEYRTVLRSVLANGLERYPRHIPTRDAGFTTIEITDAFAPQLPLNTGRNLSRAIAAVEALQLIAGETKPDLLLNVAPQFAAYMEEERPGIPAHFHGAYGVRSGTQLASVVAKLQDDPDTRQAVVTLWDPRLDNDLGKKDYPCTVGLGFALSTDHELLNMNVIMRSNDAWLGLPYDVFVFNQLQWTVANALEVVPGSYTHTAWSLHLYERDVDKVDRVVRPWSTDDEFQPRGLHAPWDVAQKIASDLMTVRQVSTNLTASERWYVDALAAVMG